MAMKNILMITFLIASAANAATNMVLYTKSDGNIVRTWDEVNITDNMVGTRGDCYRNVNWDRFGVIVAEVPEGATNTNQCTNIKDGHQAKEEKDVTEEMPSKKTKIGDKTKPIEKACIAGMDVEKMARDAADVEIGEIYIAAVGKLTVKQ